MYFGGLVWLDKNLSIDVQVQKYQYRHKLNIPRKLVRDNAFKMVNELKNLNLVFNFNNCLDVKKGQEWNQYGLGKLDKTFDIYNSSLKLKENARGLDIYTYAKIPDDLQDLKVIELVNSDLQLLDENKAKILEIINKYLNE